MTDKFNIWDSITLQDTVKHAIQIRGKIAQICTQHNVVPSQLPPSMVPTDYLFDIVIAFEALYNKLLEHNLAKTGNLNSDRNNIH